MTQDNAEQTTENPEDLPELNYINTVIPLSKIIELRNKGLSYTDIGSLLGCTRENICQRLKPYRSEVDNLKSFKDNKADILAVHQSRLLNNLTDEDIKKSSGYQKVGMFSVLHNQERLERGESTQNIAYADLTKNMTELQAKRKALEIELGIEDAQ